MNKALFGKLESGEAVHAYTLESGRLSLTILDLGGIVQSLRLADTDIVAGFDSLDGYLLDDSYQGAFIGRYANRIRDGRFTLNGVSYQLDQNENGKTHLHGGFHGFSRKILTVSALTDSSITLSVESPDGECGYPGKLTAFVTYSLTENALSISYTACADKDTPLNLTNHAYFNLNGEGSGKIYDHVIMIDADRVTEVDGDLLPTGRSLAVENTVFDLRLPKRIGDALDTGFAGYDTNFLLNDRPAAAIAGEKLPHVATVTAGKRSMRLYTDQPCVQLYIGNALTGEPPMKGGKKKIPHTTFCLETQEIPDGPNAGRGILKAGEVYRKKTVFEFLF